jgi:phosphoglycolate phosphatase-like HAD superfamily hydrolase
VRSDLRESHARLSRQHREAGGCHEEDRVPCTAPSATVASNWLKPRPAPGKPTRGFEPRIFLACAKRLGISAEDCYVVGDAVWDLLAARWARTLSVGLLSGGYGEDELTRAGAFRVYADTKELRQSLDELGVLL